MNDMTTPDPTRPQSSEPHTGREEIECCQCGLPCQVTYRYNGETAPVILKLDPDPECDHPFPDPVGELFDLWAGRAEQDAEARWEA